MAKISYRKVKCDLCGTEWTNLSAHVYTVPIDEAIYKATLNDKEREILAALEDTGHICRNRRDCRLLLKFGSQGKPDADPRRTRPL